MELLYGLLHLRNFTRSLKDVDKQLESSVQCTTDIYGSFITEVRDAVFLGWEGKACIFVTMPGPNRNFM